MVSRGRVSPTEITSRANGTFKAARGLQPGFGGAMILVEGDKLIDTALAAGLTPCEVWSHGPWPDGVACPAYRVSPDMYRALSPTRSGHAPLALFPAPVLAPLAEAAPTQGRFLLLDRVQDPGNAGALIRAAAAFGFQGILWRTPCVYPYHHAVIRASAGTVFHMRHQVGEALPETLGLPLIGAAGEDGAVDLAAFRWPRDFILAMGHEGGGLDTYLRERLSARVRIPMAHHVESLNVAGAAHILMYAARMQDP